MKKTISLILLLIGMSTYANAAICELYVGETYTCDGAAGLIGNITDKTWTTSNSYIQLDGSGFYRNVTITQYFTGTATVTFSCYYQHTSSTPKTRHEETWTFACKDNPATITPTTMTMTVGGPRRKVVCTLSKSEYLSYADIYFESTNPNVAEVDYYTGEVTAKSKGITNIIAHSKVSKVPPVCAVTVNPAAEPTSISLSASSLSLEQGTSGSLTCNFSPSNASSTVTWSSSDKNVATVTLSGTTVNVNAKSVGNTTITATTANGCTATCLVNVTPPPPPTSIKIGSMTLEVGHQGVIPRYLVPSNAATTITWTTLNPSVAIVDEAGVVTAISVGEATIKAQTDNNLIATGKVTVKQATTPTSITLNPTSITLEVGESGTITPILYPSGTSGVVSWESSNAKVVTVNSSGGIKAIGVGNATITATVAGVSATCLVVVTAPPLPTQIILNPSSLTLRVGESQKIEPSFLPVGSNATVSWRSENSSIAKVDITGKVTAVAIGTTEIYALIGNGLSAVCHVTVSNSTTIPTQPTGLTIDPTSMTLQQGQTGILTYSFTPSGTTADLMWNSGNTAVATIDNGVVTAISPGTAVVGAGTSYGLYALCVVTVTEATTNLPTSISLSPTSMTLDVGASKYIIATFYPEGTSASITWSSNRTSVATVSDMGKVTAVAAGSATITATTSNGKTATCGVYVPKTTGHIDSGTCGDNLTWDLTDSILTISGTGPMRDFDSSVSGAPWYRSYRTLIKAVIIENGCTSIGDYAFNECSNVRMVTIPNSVTSIGFSTFSHCSSLTSVTIPNSVTSVESYAFQYCTSLVNATLSNSIEEIEDCMFAHCVSLASIIIPNSVKSIGDAAFSNCSSLTSIVIPNSVTSIGSSVFSRCSGLISVTIPNSVLSIGNSAFYYCSQLSSITIPNYITVISPSLFGGCYALSSINIPTGVTSIGQNAFMACRSLTTIKIPNSVTSLGEKCFINCNGLKSVSIGSAVTEIGNSAFSRCNSLTSIVIPKSVTTIGNSAFSYCDSLININIQGNVTTIGDYAFSNCSSLPSITIPRSVATIGNGAFSSCTSLKNITIPENVKTIGEDVFYKCDNLTSIIWNALNCADPSGSSSAPFDRIKGNITSFTFGNAVEYISAYLCNGMEKLESINIPNSVTKIGKYAFQNCSGITSINIPQDVTTIELSAFYNCKALEEIRNYANDPQKIESSVFSYVDKATCYLYVPQESVSAYKSANVWKTFSNIKPMNIPETGEDIIVSGVCGDELNWKITKDSILYIQGTGDMYNYEGATKMPWYSYQSKFNKVCIKEGVTSIGNYAFAVCTNIKSVIIPSSIDSIGISAFNACYGLSEVHISDIGQWCKIAFNGILANPLYYAHHLYVNNQEIVDLIIPDTITGIEKYAFYKCDNIVSVTIPNSVTTIGVSAFAYCSGLRSITNYNTTPQTISTNVFTSVPKDSCILYVPVTSLSAYKSTSVWSSFLTVLPIEIDPTSISLSQTSMTLEVGETRNITYTLTPADATATVTWSSSNTSVVTVNTAGDVTAVSAGSTIITAKTSNGKTATCVVSVTQTTNPVLSGSCGDNLTWELKDSVLTISGTGRMYNYKSSNSPWYTYRSVIKSVDIRQGCTSLGDYAFYYCNGLTSITIPNSIDSIGGFVFYYCGKLTSIKLPNSVTSIGNYSFKSCTSLTSVTIPNSVTSIGMSAFESCTGLTSVTIPNSVISIGSSAFESCTGLISVTILNGVTSIGNGAFRSCTSLTSIAIPNSVTNIGMSAFKSCTSLASVTLPNSVTSIGSSAFEACTGLTSVTIPNSVTSIGGSTFRSCTGLTSVTIPNSVTSIGGSTFASCTSLTSVTIPNSVTSIGVYAFESCSSLTSVTIPDSVTSIGSYAFRFCTSLTSVVIPNSVTSIGGNAFSGCSSLISFTNYALTPQEIQSNVFNNIDEKKCVLYVPEESIDVYKSANVWSEFFSEIYAIASKECASETADSIVRAIYNEDHTLTIEWPAVENAVVYTIEIKMNGVSICTLDFDGEGVLLSKMFYLPTRDGSAHRATTAAKTTKGWTYTIEGLETAADYTYTVTAKDGSDTILFTESFDFSIAAPQGMDVIDVTDNKAYKILENSTIYILRGDNMYTITGQEVR